MVEFLKRSVERLEPPVCEHCNVKMIWYRSVRASEEELDHILHYFQCPNCNRIGEIKTKMQLNGDGKDSPMQSAPVFLPLPPMAAASWHHRHAAARAAAVSPYSHFFKSGVGTP